MTTSRKIILFVPMIFAALTAFGMGAVTLTDRNPSPVSSLGGTLELPFAFAPNDGKPYNN